MKVLPSPRRGYSAKYLQRKVDEAYEAAAMVAEVNDGRERGGEAEAEAMNIATHIRALKGKPRGPTTRR